jgi:threonylcarbamoyladenosine tRNA methylthiotransferase MtaB
MSEAIASFPSVVIKSIGCRTNQQEMTELHGHLVNRGFSVIEDVQEANIIIVNSCSVTSSSESKTRRLLASLQREAPSARILVTGCLAQQKPLELKKMQHVEWVVGNSQKHTIPVILAHDRGGVFVEPISAGTLPVDTFIAPPSPCDRTRQQLKVQEGCNFNCSYCIVPSLRGPSRSGAIQDITRVFRNAIQAGFKEIVLTGTHIGQFRGGDGSDLVDLLENILSLKGDFRIRLSSLDPRDVSSRLMTLFENETRICDHLHVSLQSLSGRVLAGMNRPYKNLDALVEMLVKVRTVRPFAGLGADFIVGFPGESDEDFEKTQAIAERIGFSYAHIFRFSVRPNTPAATIDGTVPEYIKTERSQRLRAMVAKSRARFISAQAGTIRRIIVEQ